jgi:LysM repeat protein
MATPGDFRWQLTGGQYQASWRQRLDWVRRSQIAANATTPTAYNTQPYDHLARVYRQTGQDPQARQVAIAARNDLRRYAILTRPQRVSNWLLDRTIKHGYQPLRAVGLLAVVAAVLLVVLRPERPASVVVSPTTRQPPATTAVSQPTALGQPMLANVVTGIVPVLAGALAHPLAELAGRVAATPADLKKLAFDNAVAPFVKSGSTKLGEAVGDAIARRTGLTPSTQPAPPSKEVTVKVQIGLEKGLEDELRSMPEVIAAARKVGQTPQQVARELATTVAQGLAAELAQGLGRLPQSKALEDPMVATVARDSAERVARSGRTTSPAPPSTTEPPPSPGRSYVVQRGDSLWTIARRMLSVGSTPHEVDEEWRAIYRANRATVGPDPDHIVPGQLLRIPGSPAASSPGCAIPLLVFPGIATAFAARRRWGERARRPAT